MTIWALNSVAVCGPGRVIRHVTDAFGSDVEPCGSDYNPATIRWCSDNIPGVRFALNGLRPPLPFGDNVFDFVYSISVFTHLSETVSHEWIKELTRVVRPGGILVITTNGDSRQNIMLADELEACRATGIVIRGKYEEGKKMYWACHSPRYLREKLFRNLEVLEHGEANFPFTGQYYWVLRRAPS